MAVLFMRFAVRLRTVGIRGLQWDDFFAFLVMIMYSCDAATVHLVCKLMLATSRSVIVITTNSREDMLGSNVEASVFQTQRSTFDPAKSISLHEVPPANM